MTDFKSCASYQRFKHVVCSEHRYVRPTDVEDFLNAVLATSRNREHEIKSGAIFWRAQLGHNHRVSSSSPDIEVLVPCPYPPDRMKPRAGRAYEGRASPKGIPALYLATDRETAMLEVRPWLSSSISIACFKAKRDLLVVDCSQGSAGMALWPSYAARRTEPAPAERERSVWTDIDLGFAEPVDRSDDVADYAPTQIIAELFKLNHYDGVKYRSALSNTGHSVALFDTSAAELDPVCSALFRPIKLSVEFEEIPTV